MAALGDSAKENGQAPRRTPPVVEISAASGLSRVRSFGKLRHSLLADGLLRCSMRRMRSTAELAFRVAGRMSKVSLAPGNSSPAPRRWF
jgi:hypothetical protein